MRSIERGGHCDGHKQRVRRVGFEAHQTALQHWVGGIPSFSTVSFWLDVFFVLFSATRVAHLFLWLLNVSQAQAPCRCKEERPSCWNHSLFSLFPFPCVCALKMQYAFFELELHSTSTQREITANTRGCFGFSSRPVLCD